MHAQLATQHEWLAAVLRGHYGYYGRPHNYPALNGFYREVRRIWLLCLRRRSQKSRCIRWPEFETLTARFRLPTPRITRTWAQARIWVTLGKSRVRESRMPGSVRAKAEWLSYSTELPAAVPNQDGSCILRQLG